MRLEGRIYGALRLKEYPRWRRSFSEANRALSQPESGPLFFGPASCISFQSRTAPCRAARSAMVFKARRYRFQSLGLPTGSG